MSSRPACWPFGDPWPATEWDVVADWNCGKPGEHFRCAWCGYRFQVGDLVRCVYTNSGAEECNGIGGNPFICAKCDGPREQILAELRGRRERFRANEFWWFRRRHG
jgi:hypothetical protein